MSHQRALTNGAPIKKAARSATRSPKKKTMGWFLSSPHGLVNRVVDGIYDDGSRVDSLK